MTGSVASLGMYDHAHQRAANDAIWAALARKLRARGIDAPSRLDRSRPVEELWRDPSLLIGQACGYPLVSEDDLTLRVVGVPVYDVPDCPPGRHLSYLVTRRDDAAATLADYSDRRAAINSTNSNSGYNLFRVAVAGVAREGRFFSQVVVTGSHRSSVIAVNDGQADIAAIDAVTWLALRRYEPGIASGTRILAKTASSPTLPYVTSRSTSKEVVAALRAALAGIAADPELADARDALFLTGIQPASIHRFASLRGLERDAVVAGYPQLR